MMDVKASRTHLGRYVVRVIERSSRALARRSRIIGGPDLPVALAAACEEGSEQQCQCDPSMSPPTRAQPVAVAPSLGLVGYCPRHVDPARERPHAESQRASSLFSEDLLPTSASATPSPNLRHLRGTK